jgi:UDP-N-acetyl-D-galactosamine dehydrogenase
MNHYSSIRAAATKWNFLPFKPELSQCHCIGVDPYYCWRKRIGYHPEIILAGRRQLTVWGGICLASQIVKLMIKGYFSEWSYALDAGITFKKTVDVQYKKLWM